MDYCGLKAGWAENDLKKLSLVFLELMSQMAQMEG